MNKCFPRWIRTGTSARQSRIQMAWLILVKLSVDISENVKLSAPTLKAVNEVRSPPLLSLSQFDKGLMLDQGPDAIMAMVRLAL